MAWTFTLPFVRDLQLGLYDVTSGAYDFQVALLKSGSHSDTYEFFSDLNLGVNELSVAGYARANVSGRTLNASGPGYLFNGDNVSWAALTAGETITAAVLGRYTAGDADSDIEYIGWMDGGSAPTELPWATDGGGFELDLSAGLWLLSRG